jgi:hypothetical protein
MAQDALNFANNARDELCRVVREAGVVPRKLQHSTRMQTPG